MPANNGNSATNALPAETRMECSRSPGFAKCARNAGFAVKDAFLQHHRWKKLKPSRTSTKIPKCRGNRTMLSPANGPNDDPREMVSSLIAAIGQYSFLFSTDNQVAGRRELSRISGSDGAAPRGCRGSGHDARCRVSTHEGGE